jgi:hypothetical protein
MNIFKKVYNGRSVERFGIFRDISGYFGEVGKINILL